MFIAVTSWLLFKNYNPQWVLLFAGILMIAIAAILGITPVSPSQSTGSTIFDVFKIIEDKFLTSIVKLGFMIMTIGGYVALMNRIKATDAMVYIATKPLSFLKGKTYLTSVMVIPIGMILYLTTPSASGLGLLLVSTIYPILVNLGVSKLTALSVISAATIFDMGPGSANTMRAAELFQSDHVVYFIGYQLPLVIPVTIVVMIVYYFTNRYFDRQDIKKGKQIYAEQIGNVDKPEVPLLFAFLPVMPLVLLIVLSKYVGLFDINISTALGMIVCVVITAVILLIYKKNLKQTLEMLRSFWDGMGSVFSSVVTLIVTAEIFAVGINSLKFIDLLVMGTSSVGLGAVVITVLMTITVFFSATMIGSGNAAFFSFGPLVPEISRMFGVSTISMLLPMQLCAGMGRATSPIAAVNVAIARIVGVSPIEIAKRNMFPMIIGSGFLLILHFIIN